MSLTLWNMLQFGLSHAFWNDLPGLTGISQCLLVLGWLLVVIAGCSGFPSVRCSLVLPAALAVVIQVMWLQWWFSLRLDISMVLPAALAVVIQVIWFQCWFFFKWDISMVLSAALAVVIQAIWLQPSFYFQVWSVFSCFNGAASCPCGGDSSDLCEPSCDFLLAMVFALVVMIPVYFC